MNASKSGFGRTQSGFDIGQQKAVGSFFSSLRQKAKGDSVNYYDSERMKGDEFVKRLMK